MSTVSRIAAASAAPDSRLLVVSVGVNGPRLGRLNSPGVEDATFRSSPVPGFVPGMLATMPDGRILCGSFPDPARPTLAKVQRFQTDGALDDTFVFEQSVLSLSAIAPLLAGEVMLGAKFEPATDFNPGLYLHRLTGTGAVDPGFVLSGTFTTMGEVNHVLLQGDGSLVIAGPTIARVGSDGTEDVGFVGRTLRGRTEAAVMLADGRMLFAGRYEGTNGLVKAQVLRLLGSGEIDPSYVITEYEGEAHRLAPMPDGRVLIGGAIVRVGGLGRRGLGRLLLDGGVDAGFVCQLAPSTPFSGGPQDVQVDGLGVRTDGRVFVAGQFNSVNGTPVVAPVAVLELDSPTEGAPQIVGLPDKLTVTEGHTLEILARVVSGVPTTNEWRSALGVIGDATLPEYRRRNVQRSDAGTYELTVRNASGNASKSIVVDVVMGPSLAGAVDVSFDAGTGAGPLTAAPGSTEPKLFVGASVGERIFLAGDFNQFGGAPKSRVIALRGDGAVDESFVWPKDVATFVVREVGAIFPLPEGKLLVGMNMSRTATGPLDRSAVGRFLPNGARDETFKNGNLLLSPARITTLSLDGKGRVLFGRRLTTTPLGRLELSSQLDPTFQPPPFLAAPGGALSVRVILPLPNGQIIVGGVFATVDGKSTGGLVRLEESGVLDTAFLAVLDPALEVVGAGLMPDGGILVGLSGAPGLVKLSANGAVDSTFHSPAALGAIRQLVVDAAGRALVIPTTVIGNGNPLRGLIRLLPTGDLDPEFEFEPDVHSLASVTLDENGQVLATGDFAEPAMTERATVVRVHGAVDGQLQVQRETTGKPVIQWGSRLGRTYRVERTATLRGGTWEQPLLGIQGTGGRLGFTDTMSDDLGFYRLRIE